MARRNLGRLAALAASAAAGVAGVALTVPALAGGPVYPPHPGSTWLDYANFYRATAGLPALTEDPTLSQADAQAAHYMVLNQVLTHQEDPSKPGYTQAGADAAAHSNLAAGGASFTGEQAIAQWMAAPFHALGVLNPTLQRFGFAIDASGAPGGSGFSAAAALNTVSDAGATPAYPVEWPGNGTSVPLWRRGGETPDPGQWCGPNAPRGGTAMSFSALPLLLQVGSAVSSVSSYSITPDGAAPFDVCELDQNKTTGVAQSILAGDTAIVLISSSPLTPGQGYTAAATVNGSAYSWHFSIARAVATATPASVDFGRVQIGLRSAAQTVTVHNTGSNAAMATDLVTIGAPFRVGRDGCTGTVLDPGQACSLDVDVTPATRGPVATLLDLSMHDPASAVPITGADITLSAVGAGSGYVLVASDGGVFPFGASAGYGSTGGMRLNSPIVGLAATPSGQGYWLVAADGGLFPFGDAQLHSYGSMGGARLNSPIVGMAATPMGNGYWLVASDGGIFPFGDAPGLGSTGGLRLNSPIVGMAATSDGHGYWLVASDGGLFPFGDAGGYGSTGGNHLNQPIVGMSPTATGHGYWLVASDGGLFPFGDAGGYGSTGGLRLNSPIVGMAATSDGHGYWLVASDGGIFPFGDAPGLGSAGGMPLNRPIAGMAGATR